MAQDLTARLLAALVSGEHLAKKRNVHRATGKKPRRGRGSGSEYTEAGLLQKEAAARMRKRAANLEAECQKVVAKLEAGGNRMAAPAEGEATLFPILRLLPVGQPEGAAGIAALLAALQDSGLARCVCSSRPKTRPDRHSL